MKFEFLIAVDIKDNGITRDTQTEELTMMLSEAILDNQAMKLPWVLGQEVSIVTRDTRER